MRLCYTGNDAFWNGWTDLRTEGTFVDSNDGRVLADSDYQPWYLGEPNGLDLENCGLSWVRRQSWNDGGCDNRLCGFCQFDDAPVFTLRGQ